MVYHGTASVHQRRKRILALHALQPERLAYHHKQRLHMAVYSGSIGYYDYSMDAVAMANTTGTCAKDHVAIECPVFYSPTAFHVTASGRADTTFTTLWSSDYSLTGFYPGCTYISSTGYLRAARGRSKRTVYLVPEERSAGRFNLQPMGCLRLNNVLHRQMRRNRQSRQHRRHMARRSRRNNR